MFLYHIGVFSACLSRVSGICCLFVQATVCEFENTAFLYCVLGFALRDVLGGYGMCGRVR